MVGQRDQPGALPLLLTDIGRTVIGVTAGMGESDIDPSEQGDGFMLEREVTNGM